MLRSEQACHLTKRCKLEGSWCSPFARGISHLFCQKKSPAAPKSIYCNWAWITCSCLGDKKISPFPVWQIKSAWSRPEALGKYSCQDWDYWMTWENSSFCKCIKLPMGLQATTSKIQLLCEDAEDGDLCSLKHIVQAGWPSQIQEVPLEKQSYWSSFEEITIEDGSVLKGTRNIIPASQRQALLKQLHAGTPYFIKRLEYIQVNNILTGLYDMIPEITSNHQASR